MTVRIDNSSIKCEHSRIDLTKDLKDLHNEHYKISREGKNSANKWKTLQCPSVEEYQNAHVSKAIYRLKVISLIIPRLSSQLWEKKNLKSKWDHNSLRITKATQNNKNKAAGITTPDFKKDRLQGSYNQNSLVLEPK